MLDLVLLLAVPVLFRIGIRRPDRLLFLWIILSPLGNNTVFFGRDLRVVSFDRLVLLASIFSLIANGQLRYLFPSRLSKFEKATIAFLLIFLFEAVITFAPRDAVSTSTKALDCFWIPFYWYLLAKYLLTREGRYHEEIESQIARSLAIVGVYSAGLAVFEGITRIDLLPRSSYGLLMGQTQSMPRANGPFGVAEVLGEYLSLTLLFSFYRWRRHKFDNSLSHRSNWLIRTAYTLLLAAGMFFTMFRNVWIGFIGGYSLRHLLTRSGRRTLLILVIVLTFFATATWTAIRDTEVYQTRISNVENIHDRLNAWLYAFRAFSEHPLVGIGYGKLKQYILGAQEQGDDLRVFDDVAATYHPHNTVVAMLGENGLLLTVPFVLLLWYFIRHVSACVRLARSPLDIEFGLFAAGGAFALLAPHLSDRCLVWNQYNNLMFLFIALVAARHAKLAGTLTSEAPVKLAPQVLMAESPFAAAK